MYEYFEALLKERKKTIMDVAKATKIAPSTFYEWRAGKHSPSLANMSKIAAYFATSVEYLLTGKDAEKESESGTKWYFTDETAEKAQEIFENPDLRILFDAARDARPEDLQMCADLLKRLKETNRNG